MGNCMVIQKKPVRVMKTDGKIIEYKAPIRVAQVLSEYTHHAVSDELLVAKHMNPQAELQQGQLYYLLPVPMAKQTTTKKKKAVRFSEDVIALDEAKQASRVVRIKVMLTKQELLEMLGKEGGSAEHMVPLVQKETTINKIGCGNRDNATRNMLEIR